MTIHAAQIAHSPRLQRFLACLSDREWRSTLQLIQQAQVCAVSSCASELRAQGIPVETKCVDRVWYYRLASPQLELLAA